MRIRKSRHRKGRRRKNPESGWGRSAGGESRAWIAWVALGALGISAVFLALRLRDGRRDEAAGQRPAEAPANDLRMELEAAEAVARAFLAERDPEKRLKRVRNAESVRGRMGEYSEEARSAPGRIDKVIGHGSADGRQVTAFAVAMPSGGIRLLEVVWTPEGPRVDWDAYARHGTASWEDLWSGKAERAVVRVFCEPSTERPAPFDDRETWTCFRMSGPDLPQMALAFAKVGSAREAMMKKVILGTPRYRQRFVLEVVLHEGGSEPLFEIAHCLAVGWILGEHAVEEDWAAAEAGEAR